MNNIETDQYQDIDHCLHTAQRSQPFFPELDPSVGEDDETNQDADPNTRGVRYVGGGVGISSHQVWQAGYNVNRGDSNHNQNSCNPDNFTKGWRCIFVFPKNLFPNKSIILVWSSPQSLSQDERVFFPVEDDSGDVGAEN